jgi:dTDP-4-dehydrorhamnose 3,5-epimerase
MSGAAGALRVDVGPCEPCPIAGAVLVTPVVHGDERGYMVESFRQEWLPAGSPMMVQSNRASRRAGAVVGLHFHRHQADYWHVVSGVARVVLHDVRVDSPTNGVTWSHDLDGDVPQGIYVPPGVAHGFSSLTDVTLTYLVDQVYTPSDEQAVAWNDPDIGADWGVTHPVLSKRDELAPQRSAIDWAAITWR